MTHTCCLGTLTSSHICESNATWHACFSSVFLCVTSHESLVTFSFQASRVHSVLVCTFLAVNKLHAFLTALAYTWTQGSLVMSKDRNRKTIQEHRGNKAQQTSPLITHIKTVFFVCVFSDIAFLNVQMVKYVQDVLICVHFQNSGDL